MTLTAGDTAIDLSWVVLPDDDVPICESACQERAAEWMARFSCGHGHYSCGPCKREEAAILAQLPRPYACPRKCRHSKSKCQSVAWERL